MDYTFTIDIEMLTAKSYYLQHLLNHLPGEKLRKILIAPSDEMVRKLKGLGTVGAESALNSRDRRMQ